MQKYNRILLKLSGESLAGTQNGGIDATRLAHYVHQIGNLSGAGVQTGIVIGGGNIFRGLSSAATGLDHVTGDQMGMLATVINGLALQSALSAAGLRASLLTAVRMEPVGEYYSSRLAVERLESGYVVIMSGGTGNPCFTTDTAAALRAIETRSDILLKGTRVDGIYSADPERDPAARKFDRITFDEIYMQQLRVMDMTAIALCRDNRLPLLVFNMDKPGNLDKVIRGESIGTRVTN
jgi:uridylate kinase